MPAPKKTTTELVTERLQAMRLELAALTNQIRDAGEEVTFYDARPHFGGKPRVFSHEFAEDMSGVDDAIISVLETIDRFHKADNHGLSRKELAAIARFEANYGDRA